MRLAYARSSKSLMTNLEINKRAGVASTREPLELTFAAEAQTKRAPKTRAM